MACDLSYDMNGSTDTQAQADEFKTVEHAESCTITSAIPTREGYKFIKWNTAADGSGTDYAPGDDFTSGDDPVTLYAQWEKSDSSVTPSNQTPSKSATTTTTSTSPKTADAINIALPAAIAVLAVAVLTLSLLKRRKN